MAQRDRDRSEEAILAAAEDLFARRGFEATTLQEIGAAAGVARSTPAYFFGSKDALYDAVLARVVAREREAMLRAYEAGDHAADPEQAVERYVGAFLDFLARDRTFVRLLQREALGDGTRVAEFFHPPVRDAVAALSPAAERAGIAVEQLVLDLVALCWYPFAHERTLLPALGMTPRDPAFIARYRDHIGEIVRALAATRDRD